MKKGLIIFVLVFAIFSIASILLLNYQQLPKESSQEISESRTQQNSEEIDTEREGMKFSVTVPENTPEGDTVWVYVRQIPHKMGKIDDFRYSLTLNETQLFGEGYILGQNERIRYRYSRNGYNFRTAEYLKPTPEEPDRDTDNYFWTKHGRETQFQAGKFQEDKVERWRFFPEEDVPIIRTTLLEPQGNFLPRISNVQFRSGQTIEDLYADAFYEFFDSTATHIKGQGYTWVEIDPPWQWTEVEGLPRVSNKIEDNPNYPDDETFLEEVRAYKQQGLKVLVAPQLCCTELDIKNRSEEWWKVYFDETQKFLVHFATLAQQTDADAFSYAINEWDSEDAQIDFEKEWGEIFGGIREVFDGEVGEMVWVLGPGVSPSPTPIPDAGSLKWADELDFILVHSDFPLSEKNNPTDEELKQEADAVLDGIKVLYDEFDKPIILRNGYFNVKYSWKGQKFYSISSIPWISDPEVALKESKYEFDTEDHARTINAQFRAIAERPWVVGYLHFGYTHWEDPLSPWMSVRGKPTEDVWRKWNEVIYSSES